MWVWCNSCRVASRIADDTGITRSVIVNALKKFDSAGVISTKSSGMKGTKIKVLNEVVYDELKKLEDWEYTLYNW